MGFTTTLGGGPSFTVSAGGPHSSGGRVFNGASIVVDRATSDHGDLQAAGWVILANHKGTTAQRPTLDDAGNPLQNGFRYLDTTLGKIVVRTAGVWIDGMTGAAA